MTREGDPPLPWSCRLRSAQAAEREPRWHKGGPRIEAQIQRVSVEPRRQKGRARGAAAAVVPKAAARTSHGEGRKPRGAQSCQGSGHPGVRRSQQLGCSHRKGALSIAPAVPHSVARPLGRLGLADGDDLVAGAIDAGRGNPVGELVSNRGEVCERGLELSLGLSPGLLGWEMSRTVGPAGGSGAAGFCGGGRGSQGRRRGCLRTRAPARRVRSAPPKRLQS